MRIIKKIEFENKELFEYTIYEDSILFTKTPAKFASYIKDLNEDTLHNILSLPYFKEKRMNIYRQFL